MSNTWPDGHRRALSQDAHAQWNSINYPGTRQLCIRCDCETERSEDDSIYTDSGDGPLCIACYRLACGQEKSE